MNVCMVGYGMMGVWHSDTLRKTNVCLHTVVGRRPEATREFAERNGYRKWTTLIGDALADPEVDIVILTTPSDQHELQAIQCLNAGKHTLIEIPIAMSLAGAERVVAAGELSGKIYGVCHPLRYRRELEPLRSWLSGNEETIRHIACRCFMKRLVNIGATGYERSWSDNILWHHFCHFVDFGLFLCDGAAIASVKSFMSAPHESTGIPMECTVLLETEANQSILVHGSYHAMYRFQDQLIVTDRETYFLDILTNTLRTEKQTLEIESEVDNCARVMYDFIEAVRDNRAPLTSGPSVLPTMRVLQQVQDQWDARYGARSIPGRPL